MEYLVKIEDRLGGVLAIERTCVHLSSSGNQIVTRADRGKILRLSNANDVTADRLDKHTQ